METPGPKNPWGFVERGCFSSERWDDPKKKGLWRHWPRTWDLSMIFRCSSEIRVILSSLLNIYILFHFHFFYHHMSIFTSSFPAPSFRQAGGPTTGPQGGRATQCSGGSGLEWDEFPMIHNCGFPWLGYTINGIIWDNLGYNYDINQQYYWY